jgi:hypothetical protein
MAAFSGHSFNIGPYGKNVLKSSPQKPVSQYSKHVLAYWFQRRRFKKKISS